MQQFLAACSPAIRYSPDENLWNKQAHHKKQKTVLKSGAAAIVGFKNKGSAPCKPKNEMLSWPTSPGWSDTPQQRGTRQ